MQTMLLQGAQLRAAPTNKHTAMGTVLHGTKDAKISEPELRNYGEDQKETSCR